jgi:hypothetical protein
MEYIRYRDMITAYVVSQGVILYRGVFPVARHNVIFQFIKVDARL